jgi:hypothetical protein
MIGISCFLLNVILSSHQVTVSDVEEVDWSVPSVTVIIKGKQYRAIIDTGADTSYFLRGAEDDEKQLGYLKLQGKVYKIAFTGLLSSDLVIDNVLYDCIIGMDFLGDKVLEIDYKQKQVQIWSSSKEFARRINSRNKVLKTTRIKFQLDEYKRPLSQLKVERYWRDFYIDSGSTALFLSKPESPACFSQFVSGISDTRMIGMSLVPIQMPGEERYLLAARDPDGQNILGLNLLTEDYARFDFNAGVLEYLPYVRSRGTEHLLRSVLTLRTLEGSVNIGNAKATIRFIGTKSKTKDELIKELMEIKDDSIDHLRSSVLQWRATATFNTPAGKLKVPVGPDFSEPPSAPPKYPALAGYCWKWFPGSGWYEHRKSPECKDSSLCWPYDAEDIRLERWPEYGLAILPDNGMTITLPKGKHVFPKGTKFKYVHPECITIDPASGVAIVLIKR